MKCTKHKCISQSPHTANFCNHHFEQLNNRMLSSPQKFSLHQLLCCLCPKWDRYPSFHGKSDFSCNISDNAFLKNVVNFSFEVYLNVNMGPIPGLGRSPGGGHGNPLQNSCLENPYGQRSLVGSSPWDCKELDTTEQLSTAQHIHYILFCVWLLSLNAIFKITLLNLVVDCLPWYSIYENSKICCSFYG